MRKNLVKDALQPLMQAIGERATGPGAVYLVGGATAVWFGWRESTVDVDICLAPEPAGLFATIEPLKRESQAFAKLNRGYARDLDDIDAMLKAGKIIPQQLLAWVDAVESSMARYPSLDPQSLRQRVKDWADSHVA